MNLIKKTQIQQIILEVVDIAKDIHQIMQRPSLWGKDYPKQNKQYIYNKICQMKNEGYLQEVEVRGRKRYLATFKGKLKILKFLKRKKEWDGKWRIVIFDIPETKKIMRNFFREKLQWLGFKQLQESVWISPYNIADEVEELIEFCHCENYVHYILVEEIDSRQILMNLFKIKE